MDYALDAGLPKGHFTGMQKNNIRDYSPQPLPVLDRFDPASRIIGLFNSSPRKRDGARVLAERLGVSVQTVDRWRLAKGKYDGTGGWIPRKYHDRIIAFAQEMDVILTKADFL